MSERQMLALGLSTIALVAAISMFIGMGLHAIFFTDDPEPQYHLCITDMEVGALTCERVYFE